MSCPASCSYTFDQAFLKNPHNTSIQFISERNTLLDKDGKEFSLDNLTPYTGLFSSDAYVVVNNGRDVVHKRTRAVMDISVFRGKLDDDSVVLLSKTPNDEVKHILVARKARTTHFIPDEDQPGAFVTISNDDYDFSAISDQFVFGEERKPPSRTIPPATGFSWSPSGKGNNSKKHPQRAATKKRLHARPRGTLFPKRHLQTVATNFVNGDGSSEKCSVFYVIPVTIFFDAEFCQLNNNDFQTTVSNIQMIVAAASIHYENNLCGRIELTGVYSDTTTCDPAESPFQQFDRGVCGSYLDTFTAYAETQKEGLGIDPASFIHLFTGLQFGRSLGCSWLPGPCGSEYVYGVGYMSFLFPDITGPAFILAHELGHNLGASHDPTSNDPPNYFMEANYNSGSDGFSPASAEVISQTLQDPLNFCITTVPANQPPSNASQSPAPQSEVSTNPSVSPLVSPSFAPTAVPTTSQPTRLPSSAPTPLPTSLQPTVPPSFAPTADPTTSQPTSPPSFAPTPLPTSLQPIVPPSFAPTSFTTTLQPTRPPSFAPTPFPTTLQPIVPPSFAPTPLPTTRRPSRRPTIPPVSVHPSRMPTTHEPTWKPTEPPTSHHPTGKLTTLETSTQPIPAPTTESLRPSTNVPTTVAPSSTDEATCVYESQFVDPVCVHASSSGGDSSDFACYNTRELLLFVASTMACDSRAEIVVEECTDQYLPYPGSFALGSEHYDDDDVSNDGAVRRDLEFRSDVRYRRLASGTSAALNLAPACSDSCSEVDDRICFRSMTEPGLDRWFRVRYTVRDPFMTSSSSGGASASMTVFVVIKENGQTECDRAGVVACFGDSPQMRMWKDAGFRDFGE